MAETRLAGPGGRLNALRRLGLAYDVEFDVETLLQGGGIFASLAVLDDRESDLRRELLKLLNELPSNRTELLHTVVGAIARAHIRRQRGDRYLHAAAYWILSGRDAGEMERSLLRLRSVAPEDLRAFARRYFPAGREPHQEESKP